jgi:2-(1,2-epoxy-1,2-dihydrophenyl)acetyl-CoA isomerase
MLEGSSALLERFSLGYFLKERFFMTTTTHQHLLVSTSGSVQTITLNRPDHLNALTAQLAEDIQAAVHAASTNDDVRVIVLTGAGRGFCAGLDLTNAPSKPFDEQSRNARLDPLGWVSRQALTLTSCDKIIIAAINGAAAGAGLSLALAADIRLMAAGAKVTTGYLRRGLSPDGGMAYFLPRLVGASRAAELILSARDIPAEEAERIGLVSRVLPAEGFQAAVAVYAADLASGPPVAQTLAKRLLIQSPDLDLPTMLRQEIVGIRTCFTTEDVREGMLAFLEKRKPVFKGK